MEPNSSSINRQAISTFEGPRTKLAIARQIWTHPLYFIAFGFGSGLLPYMPGTWGTLIAIPFYLVLRLLPWQIYLAVVLIAFVVGIHLCGSAERLTQLDDHPGIVWDEIVGFWITMFLAPPNWYWILLGFGLFRIFDILKPWPISWINKNVDQGFGVMADDLVAGVFSFFLLQITVALSAYLL